MFLRVTVTRPRSIHAARAQYLSRYRYIIYYYMFLKNYSQPFSTICIQRNFCCNLTQPFHSISKIEGVKACIVFTFQCAAEGQKLLEI